MLKTLPTKPKPNTCKAIYKIRHFIRIYSDRQHPEQFEDIGVNSRTTRPLMRENLEIDAYQFYDVLDVSYSDSELDNYTTEPRNFSKLYLNERFDDRFGNACNSACIFGKSYES